MQAIWRPAVPGLPVPDSSIFIATSISVFFGIVLTALFGDVVLIILVLGLNYAPERIGIAVYTSGMAQALAAQGHDVSVVAGRPYYPNWRVFDADYGHWDEQSMEQGVSVRRVWHYVPAHPSGLKRLLHHASFALSALIPLLWLALCKRPDVVLTVAPSLVAAPVAWLAARLAGAKAWLHVQDLEVDTAFATGLLAPDGAAGRVALGFERLVMRRFDTVSGISPQICARLVGKGVERDRVVEFRNWADVDMVRPLVAVSPYRAEWGITTPQVALYAGNIGIKQGLEVVIAAARLLAHRDDLSFVICGEGPNRARLEQMAAGLGRVQFRDLQPRDRLDQLMGLATIHLLPQMAGVADLVLPSKLNNMLASGRPIVAAAAEGTGLWTEVEGCGVTVAPGDAAAFAAGIERLATDPELAAGAGRNARARAEQRWSKARIMADFEQRLGEAGVQTAPAGARSLDAQ